MINFIKETLQTLMCFVMVISPALFPPVNECLFHAHSALWWALGNKDDRTLGVPDTQPLGVSAFRKSLFGNSNSAHIKLQSVGPIHEPQILYGQNNRIKVLYIYCP